MVKIDAPLAPKTFVEDLEVVTLLLKQSQKQSRRVLDPEAKRMKTWALVVLFTLIYVA